MIDRRVLIVDDNAEFRRLARQLLEHGGYEVVGEAGDAAGALRAHAALRPDIVLLDIQLPDQDGFAVAETLGRRCRPADCGADLQPRPRAYRRKLAATTARAFLPKGELALRHSTRRSAHDCARHCGRSRLPVSCVDIPPSPAEAGTPAAATGLLWFAGDLVGRSCSPTARPSPTSCCCTRTAGFGRG